MRSLKVNVMHLGLILALLLLISGPLKAEEGFFTVDVEVVNFEQNKLDQYFTSALETLLVRLSGNPDITAHPHVRQLIAQPRAWVRHYQLVNRQIEGVVTGQDVRVDFNASGVINQLQQAAIPIWPQADRPQILVVGDWVQRGLRADFSSEGFSFRPDLDFRFYPNLVGLPNHYLSNASRYSELGFDPIPTSISNDQMGHLQASNNAITHLLILSAQVVGDVVQLRAHFYDLVNKQLLWEQVVLGEDFNSLVIEQFERILREESSRYYASVDTESELWLEIDMLPDAQALTRLEQHLRDERLIFENVRLIQVDGRAASFALRYRGHVAAALRSIEMALPLEFIVDDRALGYVRYQYQYLH
jgi:hypothetical protein